MEQLPVSFLVFLRLRRRVKLSPIFGRLRGAKSMTGTWSYYESVGVNGGSGAEAPKPCTTGNLGNKGHITPPGRSGSKVYCIITAGDRTHVPLTPDKAIKHRKRHVPIKFNGLDFFHVILKNAHEGTCVIATKACRWHTWLFIPQDYQLSTACLREGFPELLSCVKIFFNQKGYQR